MKKINLLLLLAFCLPIIMNAQWNSRTKVKGNGNMITKNISTTNYDQIAVSGFFEVELVSGEEGKITLQAEENLVEYIIIKVENNTLKMSIENEVWLNPSRGHKVLITVPFESLTAVSLSGSGDIRSKNKIKAAEFKSTLSGSGDIHLDIDAKEVTGEVTGSGDMVLKGKSEEFKCTVTGSGDLNATGLESAIVSAKVTGSGDCSVYCSESLEARVTGSGDISYYGDPKKKDTKVTGSGDISKR